MVSGSHDTSKETFFKNIYKVQPGEVLKYDFLKKFFQSRNVGKDDEKTKNFDSFETAKKYVQEKFMKNVRLHLRSDVDVSSSLSGAWILLL